MVPNLSTSHSDSARDTAPEPRLTAVWLFIIGVLAIELALHFFPEGFMTRTLVHRTEEMRYLPPTDIQLMGDSATSAVRAGLLEHAIGTGNSISNYSLPGTSPMFNYFVLRRQIAAKRVPNIIVMAPNPFTWGDPMLDRFLGRFATPAESLRFLRDQREASDWLYGTLCRLSYTLRYREELYKFVTSGDTEFFTTWDRGASSVQNTRAKITPEDRQPDVPTKSSLDLNNIPPLVREPISIHRYNEYYLHKFCSLANANGIRIVWITLPVAESLYPGDERVATYKEFLARMKSRHPNLHTITAGVPTMPDTYYSDPWHMNAYGTWVFSNAAGAQLSEWLKANPSPAGND